jgi:hypothetical protein
MIHQLAIHISSLKDKIEDIKLHVLKEDKELGIPDYKNIIKEQAAKLGKSTTAYIMDLVEEDIRNNKDGLYINDFHIIRGMNEVTQEENRLIGKFRINII